MQKKKKKPQKKKQARSAVPFAIGFAVVAGIVLFVLYVEFFRKEGKPVIWPEGHSVYGVDVSRYQREVKWDVVRQNGIAFAFLKATEGTSLQDKYFEKNWDKAREAGVIRGAYHFYIPSRNPLEQARNFTNMVVLKKGDLPPVLDIEIETRKNSKQIREGISIWLDEVEKKYGVKPIIYTNHYFYKTHLEGYFDEYHLWLAHYKVKRPKLEKSEKVKLAFWQHTDDGKIEGIDGMVDCNVFYGSLRELRNVCIKQEIL